MIANPDKFHAIIVSKNRKDHSGIELTIDDKKIKTEPWVKLLGVKIDDKLKFDIHVNDLVKSCSGQLNDIRLNPYLNYEAKYVLIQSFIYANFNYCPHCVAFCLSYVLAKGRKSTKACSKVSFK